MICSFCNKQPPTGTPCSCGKHLIPTDSGYLLKVTKPKNSKDGKTNYLPTLKAISILAVLQDSFSRPCKLAKNIKKP